MPFNLPTPGQGSEKRITLGTGVLAARAWDGVTPASTDELGYGRGATFSATRTYVEATAGVPRGPIVQYAIQEDANLQFTGLEMKLERLQLLTGTGALSGTETAGPYGREFGFGGDMLVNNVSLRFKHEMPGTAAAGATLILDIWKAQGNGELNLSFADDIIEIPYNFRALIAQTGWGNVVLPANQQMFKLRLYLP